MVKVVRSVSRLVKLYVSLSKKILPSVIKASDEQSSTSNKKLFNYIIRKRLHILIFFIGFFWGKSYFLKKKVL